MKHISEVHSLYLPTDEISSEPEEVTNANAMPDTLKTRGTVRGLSKHGFHYLKFFFLSDDKEPPYTQRYEPECSHADNFADENTCAFCLRKYHLSVNISGCNIQFVSAGFTKTVFSIDMYIYCLVEVQNFRFNLMNVS